MPNPAAGFFGKLPSAGDFVQRRLPPGFVDVWDRHFENAVAASRGALGGGWHDAYHASPVWRFLLAAGACGESAWAGIMGPGVDRVGRCFPMVIAAPAANDGACCRRVLTAGRAWFDAAEQVHGAAQADAAIGVDRFDEQVAALAGPLDLPPPSAAEFLRSIDWTAASHGRLPLPAGSAAATPLLDEVWMRLAATPGRWCLWWTVGGERVPASVLVTNGLPSPAAYAGYLDAGSMASWQSPGAFADAAPPRYPAPVDVVERADVFASPSPPAPPPSAAWLPDDLELLSGLGVAASAPPPWETAPGQVAAAAAVAVEVEAPAAAVAVQRRPDAALTLVAAETGHPDRRQQAVAAVSAIGRDLPGAELAAGVQALRTRIMALNPPLRLASEDLIDPVLEDCAVIAAQVAGDHADVLRIGTAAAWHWRRGRLQPCFANGAAPAQADSGSDDFDDLLFNRAPLATPGLGAAAQPSCGEVRCAVESGDRLLLMATEPLLQLPPDVLARGLALPSCDGACRHIATAAGLGPDATCWPLAIIEIDA